MSTIKKIGVLFLLVFSISSFLPIIGALSLMVKAAAFIMMQLFPVVALGAAMVWSPKFRRLITHLMGKLLEV